jgi:hypothetical protein
MIVDNVRFIQHPAGPESNILFDVEVSNGGDWSKVGQMMCGVEAYLKDGEQKFLATYYHARINGKLYFEDVRHGNRFGHWINIQTEDEALETIRRQIAKSFQS